MAKKRKNKQQQSTHEEESLPIKSKCKHLCKALNFLMIKKIIKFNQDFNFCKPCTSSSKSETNDPTIWMCLQCGYNSCGGNTSKSHSHQHYVTPHSDCHSIVVCLLTWEVWCYECNEAIELESSNRLKECLEYIKKRIVLVEAAKGDSDKKTLKVEDSLQKESNEEKEIDKEIQQPLTKQNEPVLKKTQEKIVNRAKTFPCFNDRFTHVKGIKNIGNTCFFNSILQNLNQTQLLHQLLELYSSQYFSKTFTLSPINNSVIEDNDQKELKVSLPKTMALTNQLVTFLKDMKCPGPQRGNAVLNPSSLYSEMGKLFAFYEEYNQQDCQELLRSLLDSIRNEEIKRQKIAVLESMKNMPNFDIKEEKWRQTIKGLKSQVSHTIIDMIFGGHMITTIQCLECNYKSHLLEPILDLSLPLAMEPEINIKKTSTKNFHKSESQTTKKSLKPRRKGRMKALAETNKCNQDVPNNPDKENNDPTQEAPDSDSSKISETSNKEEEEDLKDLSIVNNEEKMTLLCLELKDLVNKSLAKSENIKDIPNDSDMENNDATQEMPDIDPNIKNKEETDLKDPLTDNDQNNSEFCLVEEDLQIIQKEDLDKPKENVLIKIGKNDAGFIDKEGSDHTEEISDIDPNQEEKNLKDESAGIDQEKLELSLQEDANDPLNIASLENIFSLNIDEYETPVLSVAICEPEPKSSIEEKTSDQLLEDSWHTACLELKGCDAPEENASNKSVNDPDLEELNLQLKDCTISNPDTEELQNEFMEKLMVPLSPAGTHKSMSLEAALDLFTSPELLSKDNKYNCSNCAKIQRAYNKDGTLKSVFSEAKRQTLLLSCPANLTLHLKRFRHCNGSWKKENRHIDFPSTLNMAPYCSSRSVYLSNMVQSQKEVLYSLYGVVEHSGQLGGGHYIAYVKARSTINNLSKFAMYHPISMESFRAIGLNGYGSDDSSVPPPTLKVNTEGEWYYISDETVRKVNLDQVLRAQAYMLFYERIQ